MKRPVIFKKRLAAPAPRIATFPLVSGDGFRSICDFVWNETTAGPDSRSEPSPGDVWFCKTDYGAALADWLAGEGQRLGPFDLTLIIHNGDVLPDPEVFSALSGIFKRVFSVNITDGDRRRIGRTQVAALPIGIENFHWQGAGRPELFPPLASPSSGRQRWDQRPANALACFDIQTNQQVRGSLRDLIDDLGGADWKSPTLSQEEYFEEIQRSRFVLSPPGNGPDCHRTWEALYLGAIPVVLADKLDSSLSDALPILAVSGWEDFLQMPNDQRLKLGQELLARSRDMLDLGYWYNRIRKSPLRL